MRKVAELEDQESHALAKAPRSNIKSMKTAKTGS